MKIFLTNLGKYTEGYLIGKWVKLPVSEEVLDKVLEEVEKGNPDGSKVSVMATSMYLTHLYEVDELYSTIQAFDTHNTVIIYTDIVILDLRSHISDSKNAELWTRKYQNQRYEIVEEFEHEGIIRVLKRTEDSPPTGYSKAYLDAREAQKNAES